MFIHIRDFLKNFFKNRKLSRPLSHFTPRIQRTTCGIYISNHLSMLQRASKQSTNPSKSRPVGLPHPATSFHNIYKINKLGEQITGIEPALFV